MHLKPGRIPVVLAAASWVLMAWPLVVPAQDASEFPELLEPFAEPVVEPVATVVTTGGDPEICLSGVTILEIDGEEVSVDPSGFELPPGPHSMNGRVVIDTSRCPIVPGETHFPVPDLEAFFEADRVYHVGLDHSSPDTNDWRLVVWQVDGENVEEGQFGPVEERATPPEPAPDRQ
ncbi:MAG: hypothetical protein GWM87_07095 [Xanthomonadales bacterium]|nr:hypothetical protein [Xanthomonadales bacterium]NIX12722.1 hypothetical protein [Xanthomonadales bacterium]